MAYNAGSIFTKFKTNVRNFQADIKSAKDELGGFGRQAQMQARKVRMAGMALSAFAAGTAAVTLGLAKMGSAANETESRYRHIFDGMENRADEWVKDFTGKFNQVTSETQNWIASLQDTFVPIGVASEKAFELSTSLTELSVDLGSFRNLDTAKVMEDIQSAMVGQHRTMRKYGVIITETRMKQHAITKGWIEEGEELDELQKIYARYELIMEGTEKAQGDYLRTQDSFANQLRETRKLAKEIGETMGKDFIPPWKTGLGLVKSIFEWFRDLPEPMRQSVSQITLLAAGLSAVVGPLMIIISLIPQLKIGLLSLQTAFMPFMISGAVVTGLILVLNTLMNIRRQTQLIAKDSKELVNSIEAEEQLKAINDSIRIKRREYDTKMEYVKNRSGQDFETTPWEETEEGKRLTDKKREVESRLKELKAEEDVIAAEQKILEEMRTKRSEMVAGDITEEEYKKYLQKQIDAEKWSADIRAQMVMELESLNAEVESNITDYTQDEIDERAAIRQEYNDKLEMWGKEGLDAELTQINQKYRAEMKNAEEAKATEEELAKIRTMWANEWQTAVENNVRKNYEIRKEFENKTELLGKEGLEYELELLEQERKERIESYNATGKLKESIEDYYDKRVKMIHEKYRQEEIEAEKEAEEERRDRRLNEIEGMRLQREKEIEAEKRLKEKKEDIRSTLTQEINQMTMSEYEYKKWQIDKEYEYYAQFVEDKLLLDKWYNAAVQRLEEDTYRVKTENARKEKQDREDRFNAAFERYKILTSKVGSTFYDLGFSIEEIDDIYKDFRTSLIDGLTEAITKGESLKNVLTSIADQMAQMIIKKSIVTPAVDWMLSAMSFHEGGLVGRDGIKIPRFHDGVNLKKDEVPAILQTGERVLSREENAAFEEGAGRQPINVYITAQDSQDVYRSLTKDGGKAFEAAFSKVYRDNGRVRKIVNGGGA